MTAARSDDMQIEALLTGAPQDRERYVLTTLSEMRHQVASIAQHCRYCDDHGEGHGKTPAGDPEQAHRTWLMWGAGKLVLERFVLPVLAATAATIITLLATGSIGG